MEDYKHTPAPAELAEPPQTEMELNQFPDPAVEDNAEIVEKVPASQTDSEMDDPGMDPTVAGVVEASESAFPQTGMKSEDSGLDEPIGDGGYTAETPLSQTDSQTVQSAGNSAAFRAEENPAEMSMTARRRIRRAPRRQSIVSIDAERTVETDADKSYNDLLDLLESKRTKRILTGTIQGVESSPDRGEPNAIVYHGDYKVIIPASETVAPPENAYASTLNASYQNLLTKRLGAEIDYIVKGVDEEAKIAVASRLEAMAAKRKQYYFGTDRDGNYILYSDLCAEARVISVIRAGIFIDLFGAETYIPIRELSYQRLMDATSLYQPGQRILVKILDVDRADRNNIKVRASVKAATENPVEKVIRTLAVGNCYVGTVSMVDTNGVFVALDRGIDCMCNYPKRGRPPKGAHVTVRLLGINRETNRIWGTIIHIAAPR